MPVISCTLMGGLGNQLFQLFTTIAYGIRYSREYVFTYSEVLNIGIQRNTYWENFLNSLKTYTTHNQAHQLSNQDIDRFPKVNEPGFQYKEMPEVNPFKYPNISLHGYFQSYKHFDHCREQLLDMIQLKKQSEEVLREFLEKNDCDWTQSHNVSMHFRLGDYKLNPRFHPIMPYAYYKNSLDTIVNARLVDTTLVDTIVNARLLDTTLVDNKQVDKLINVFFFCEKEDNADVNQIIDQLKIAHSNVRFIKVDDTIIDYKQMLLMSCCHDNIIANSTFSWWGGYFNDHADKIVCYPEQWFGPANPQNVDDLFPSNWKRISITNI